MSILISGILVNPAGVPVAGAEITFTALTTSESVLNGFSASIITNDNGEYAIPLEYCVYSISIQSDGHNTVYGAVSITEKSTPATINELLKLAAMEQTVTPAIIVYFREIQADVAEKLAAVKALNSNAEAAASSAVAAKNEAAQYAQSVSLAVSQAQQASLAASNAASIAETAAENATETLSYYQQQLVGWQQILTGSGDVTLTAPDGQTVTVRSQKAWDDALNGKVTGVKQGNSTDSTFGRILVIGDSGSFGLGGSAQSVITQKGMLFSYSTTTRALAEIGLNLVGGGIQSGYNTNRRAQIFVDSGGVMRARWSLSEDAFDTTTPWRTVWDSANLIKQTGPFDATVGALALNTAWGWGGNGQAISYDEPTLLSWYKNTSIGSRIYRNEQGSNQYDKRYSPTILLRTGDTFAALSIGFSPSIGSESFGVRAVAGNQTAQVVHNFWTDKTLANPATLDAAQSFTGKKTFSSGIEDSVTQIGKRVLSSRLVLTSSTRGQLLSAVQGQVILVASQNDGSDPAYLPDTNFAAGDGYSYTVISRHNADANIAVFLVTNLTATKAWFFRIYNSGNTREWSEIILSGPTQNINGNKTFQSFSVIAGSGNTGIEIGRLNAASSSFIDFHTSGNNNDYDVRLLAGGGAAAIGKGTLNISAENLQWNGNAVIDAATAQTLSGTKKFTAMPIIQQNNATLGLESLQVSESTVGRWVQLVNGGATLRFYIRAGSGGAPIATGDRFITIPTAATGNVLVTGNNAVADSNGFWKSASPVVKLFADGTSELTSEAEGITTERLSEGVYRISGCLGLNADLAWGGIEGGISCPKCRNGLERVWNDYDVESDGSIVIRTYHRPHPDAPVFARNEIEGYANGDPIDIPRDTFISVRVQMPEREEPKPKVMHSNVYCNTVS